MRNNKVLTFFFAMVPGAAHMYLGQMRKGVVLATVFFGLFGAVGFLFLSFLGVLLPVVWLFAFFDAFRVVSLPEDARQRDEDNFVATLLDYFKGGNQQLWQQRFGKWMGAGLVFSGVFLLLRGVLRPILWQLLEVFPALADIFYNLPSVLVAGLLIYIGLRLLRGLPFPGTPAAPGDDLKEYNHDRQ